MTYIAVTGSDWGDVGLTGASQYIYLLCILLPVKHSQLLMNEEVAGRQTSALGWSVRFPNMGLIRFSRANQE